MQYLFVCVYSKSICLFMFTQKVFVYLCLLKQYLFICVCSKSICLFVFAQKVFVYLCLLKKYLFICVYSKSICLFVFTQKKGSPIFALTFKKISSHNIVVCLLNMEYLGTPCMFMKQKYFLLKNSIYLYSVTRYDHKNIEEPFKHFGLKTRLSISS